MASEKDFDFTKVDWRARWDKENPDRGSQWTRWFMSEQDQEDFEEGRIQGEWTVETKDVLVTSLDNLGKFFLPPYIFRNYLAFVPNRYPLPQTVSVEKRTIKLIAFESLDHLAYHFTPTNPVDQYLIVISYQGILQGAAPNEFIRVIPAELIAKTDPMLKARYDQIIMLDVIDSGAETTETYIEDFLAYDPTFDPIVAMWNQYDEMEERICLGDVET